MPFISEEIARNLLDKPDYTLMNAEWPVAPSDAVMKRFLDAGKSVNWLVSAVSSIRSMRSEKNLGGKMLPLTVKPSSAEAAGYANDYAELIKSLARIDNYTVVGADFAFANDAVQLVVSDAVLAVPLGSIIDPVAEKARLNKEIEKTRKEAESLACRLSNESLSPKPRKRLSVNINSALPTSKQPKPNFWKLIRRLRSWGNFF